jgi:glycosyltransferase involved in cell wall biosynthesis
MGAPQSRLFETAKGLRNKGWDIRILTSMPNYPAGKIFREFRNKFFISSDFKNLATWRYWLYASNSKKSIPRIISMVSFSLAVLFSVRRIKKFKPDYIFTESPPLTLGLSGLILSKLSGAKHVMNVSDIWPLSAYELGAISKGFLYNKLERLERFLYKNSFACTGQSQQIVDHLVQSKSRLTHLYRNGVDFERFNNVRTVSTPSINPKIKIVYAGLLGLAQGIFNLCKNLNFSELNAEFHIYGDGAEKDEIANYLDNNFNKGIFLYPAVQREYIPQVLMKYDITIIPLIKPIFGAIPSKIYEAMAAGLPIIFSGGGEGEYIIEKYKIGWICSPSNFKDIKDTVLKIASMDKNKLLLMKENCINAAHQIFNRKIQIEQLNDFLSDNI